MKCSLIWWCTNEIKIHLSHIWVRFKQDIWNKFRQDLSQIWAELKWWRLNLKFLTLILKHHTWQYMWFFDDRIDEMIFIECLFTIIQKIERFSSRKVIFSINVILKQKWVTASIILEVQYAVYISESFIILNNNKFLRFLMLIWKKITCDITQKNDMKD